MQRTAIQGSPAAVSAVTGTWVTGAPRNTDGVHPFRKSLAELRIGDAVVAGPRVITLDDIEAFADLSGDTLLRPHGPGRPPRPTRSSRAGSPTATSWCPWPPGCSSPRSTGPVLANYGLENLTFTTPVYPGDALTVALTAKASRPASTPTRAKSPGMPSSPTRMATTVATYDVLTSVAKTWPAS